MMIIFFIRKNTFLCYKSTLQWVLGKKEWTFSTFTPPILKFIALLRCIVLVLGIAQLIKKVLQILSWGGKNGPNWKMLGLKPLCAILLMACFALFYQISLSSLVCPCLAARCSGAEWTMTRRARGEEEQMSELIRNLRRARGWWNRCKEIVSLETCSMMKTRCASYAPWQLLMVIKGIPKLKRLLFAIKQLEL